MRNIHFKTPIKTIVNYAFPVVLIGSFFVLMIIIIIVNTNLEKSSAILFATILHAFFLALSSVNLISAITYKISIENGELVERGLFVNRRQVPLSKIEKVVYDPRTYNIPTITNNSSPSQIFSGMALLKNRAYRETYPKLTFLGDFSYHDFPHFPPNKALLQYLKEYNPKLGIIDKYIIPLSYYERVMKGSE